MPFLVKGPKSAAIVGNVSLSLVGNAIEPIGFHSDSKLKFHFQFPSSQLGFFSFHRLRWFIFEDTLWWKKS
ncbi:hypothetical protein GQ457_04G014510 [Hibiscus cannabinus]